MKLSKVILLSTVCSFCNAADFSYAAYNTSEGLSLVSTSGIHTYHTQHLTDETPFLPHPRGAADGEPPLAQARGGMFHTERSAMLTSCLPQALSSSSPEVGEARWGVTSEASISLSSKRYNLSFEGLIPPRELLTRLKSGEFLLPLPQGENNKLNVFKTASVCFITDTGACSGEKFSNDETPGNGNGNPGGIPDYDTPQEQCQAAGYGVTSCPAGAHGDNPCPADSAYYQKCVCDANMTQTCTKPYYGVGPQCDGKYASCKRDDDKACKEDGYGQTAQCSSVQTPNKKCSYNSGYYDKCVCRSDLVTCTYPQSGVGEACGGKYASCCTPLANQTGCNCYSCSNGCGGIRQCCGTCHTHSYSCPNGYQSSPCGAGYQQIGTSSKSCSCGEISGICYKCSYSGSSGSEGGESGKYPTACIGSITALKKTDGGASWCASETPGSIIYPMCGCAYGCITVNGGTKITEYRYWRNPGGGKNYSTAERAACEAEAATLPCTGACR